MPIDFASIHSLIGQEVRSRRKIQTSMQRVIDECRQSHAHQDWDELRSIDFADMTRIEEWLTPLFKRKVKCQLQGLWFGLYNPGNFATVTADMRVYGSEHFDANDLDNSWAVGCAWTPASRAKLEPLNQIYKIGYRNGGLGNNAEYPLGLAYSSLVIRDAMRQLRPKIFLRDSMELGIAVGFDAGDFILLGRLTPTGLKVHKG